MSIRRLVTRRRPVVDPFRKSYLRCELLEARETPADVSAPAFLQWFESTSINTERRMPDFHRAGYGGIWFPPASRADQGSFSVGYDVYDRFDLGSPGNFTLYGSETGLKTLVRQTNKASGNFYADFILNHNGFSSWTTPGFLNAGGYPGFFMSTGGGSWGDFHDPSAGGDINGQLSGLIDIAQESNHQYVRSPVPGFANNLPPGTTPAFGRLANVPNEANRRLYPDRDLTPILVFDPQTGEANIPIYPFNNANPTAGDPVPENALGILMRSAQWMVQTVGVDGFRLDAVKHFPTWVLNYFDRAVYRSSTKTLLNGAQQHVFSFQEVYDGSKPFLQGFIRKNINPTTPGVVGGNRDVLDFPFFFAVRDNLTNNGIQNSWFNVINSSIDSQDDGLANNGSQGVAFVQSHDNGGPHLSNVAYAYMLMRPGNANVYFNAKQFGNGRSFPADGRGDALGGFYGDVVPKLVQIRNAYGRGNYLPRVTEKETLIYERENSAIVLLSNRLDAGYDQRTIQTSFPAGTTLVELTGNATNPTIDPNNDLFDVVTVGAGGVVTVRVPRNKAPGTSGAQHNSGFLIYGPSAPIGALTIIGSSATMPAETPTANTNGTALLSAIPVITGNSFQVQLDTSAVTLTGGIRDVDADGDNALIMIDGGIDVNGSGKVDFTTVGDASYGFDQFVTEKSPGFGSPTGTGKYVQTIDASQLSEGIHYITVRAFRHRSSGPAIYRDFRVAVYIDRLETAFTIDSFAPLVTGVEQNRRAAIRSTDLTANNVHVFLNLPAGLSDASIISMVGAGSQANQIDRDLWIKDFNNLASGNHVLTVVTFERNGNTNVQRFPGRLVNSPIGAGLGDLNFDGQYTTSDVALFNQQLISNNTLFNPAGDLNGDGLINNTDLLLFGQKLTQVGATAALTLYRSVLGPLTSYSVAEGKSLTLNITRPTIDTPSLTFSWDLNNDGVFGDVTGNGTSVTWAQLVSFGINVAGSYPIALQSSEGTTSFTQSSAINVTSSAPTATLGNNGPVAQFSSMATVSFTNVAHPSPPVQTAGFTYSYDFDNDGVFEITNSMSASVSVPAAFLIAPSRTVRGRVTAVGNGLSQEYLTTITVVAPPRVQLTAVNDGAVQRSRVTSLTVTFDGLVVLPTPPELAFSVTKVGGGTVTLSADTSMSTGTQTIVKLTFSGPGTTAGSLDDGRYVLSVFGSQIVDGFGQNLDGDGNGTAGGDYAFNFHRLFGDSDGDATVTTIDFNAFRSAFGGTGTIFDFDGNGNVGTVDFTAFRQRFGSSV